MNGLRVASLMAATMHDRAGRRGLFGIYANAFMPGLAKTDDKTFVGAFQAVDRAIINPVFLGIGFLGALLLHRAGRRCCSLKEKALPWIAVAFVLYLITMIITVAVNVPLNDALKAAGDPNTIDVTAVRAAFDESPLAHLQPASASSSALVAFGLLGLGPVPHRQVRRPAVGKRHVEVRNPGLIALLAERETRRRRPYYVSLTTGPDRMRAWHLFKLRRPSSFPRSRSCGSASPSAGGCDSPRTATSSGRSSAPYGAPSSRWRSRTASARTRRSRTPVPRRPAPPPRRSTWRSRSHRSGTPSRSGSAWTRRCRRGWTSSRWSSPGRVRWPTGWRPVSGGSRCPAWMPAEADRGGRGVPRPGPKSGRAHDQTGTSLVRLSGRRSPTHRR